MTGTYGGRNLDGEEHSEEYSEESTEPTQSEVENSILRIPKMKKIGSQQMARAKKRGRRI
jgi:hypothetical protein